jgi:hypothetical protein
MHSRPAAMLHRIFLQVWLGAMSARCMMVLACTNKALLTFACFCCLCCSGANVFFFALALLLLFIFIVWCVLCAEQ